MSRPEAGESLSKGAQWLAFAACLAAFVLIRLPWVGHLLTWDEAMNLCSTRSFVTHTEDFYAFWFWTHPPLYSFLLMLVSPLYPGFAERAELVSLAAAAASFIALFFLNRRVFGAGPALVCGFVLALTPVAAFYDLWVKQEGLVNLLGLISVLLFLRNRFFLSGVALGLAFLSKELAAFYAACLVVLWLVSKPRRRFFDLFVLFGVALILSVSWYIQNTFSMKTSFALATGARIADVADWTRPLDYFAVKLRQDLGLVGLVLCVGGAVTSWWLFRRASAEGREGMAWPLAFLLPALTVLQLSHAKAPWFTMTLYPSLATLAGLGLYGAYRVASAAATRVGLGVPAVRTLGVAVLLAFAARSAVQFRGTSYDALLRAQDPGWAWGAAASRESALTLNVLAREGQRALITPAYYWHDQNRLPDPIFVYYLKDIPVVVRPFDISPADLVKEIREYELDWVVISPEPGDGERRLAPLVKKYRLTPLVLEGAYVFKTTSLYSDGGPKGKKKEKDPR